MKRLAVLLFGALLLVFGTTLPAQAVSPHFISAAGTLNADGSLTVNFKESGLGNNQNIDYLLTADATATYVCVNHGGANPSAQNKTTVSGPVSAAGTFNSGKNGNIVASLTVQPPPSDISCPKGQVLEVASVSYTNVSLSDVTDGIPAPVAGTFDSGCLLPDVRGAC